MSRVSGIPAWETPEVVTAWRGYAARVTSPLQRGLAVAVIAGAVWTQWPGPWAWLATVVAVHQLGVAAALWGQARVIRRVLGAGPSARWTVRDHVVTPLRTHAVALASPAGDEVTVRVHDAGWPVADEPVRTRPATGPWQTAAVVGDDGWLVLLRDGSQRPVLARRRPSA
jgi:hypothetical protein